jgi:flagellar assembly factor FliW
VDILIVQTLSSGELHIAEEDIYLFPNGIPGFEDETKFAVIAMEEGPFSYLQSLKNAELSFLVSDPFIFFPEYEFELPDEDTEELEIRDGILVRCIVTIKEQVEQTTMNLLAPIVLNSINQLGRQTVLHNSPYLTKHLLWSDQPTKTNKGGE